MASSLYDELNEERHCYRNIYNYDRSESGLLITKGDSDNYNITLPLEISFNINAAFNGCTAGQKFNQGSIPGSEVHQSILRKE